MHVIKVLWLYFSQNPESKPKRHWIVPSGISASTLTPERGMHCQSHRVSSKTIMYCIQCNLPITPRTPCVEKLLLFLTAPTIILIPLLYLLAHFLVPSLLGLFPIRHLCNHLLNL